MVLLQDLPETPKYLLTITVGVSQKAAINEAVKKVSLWNTLQSSEDVYLLLV